MSESFLDLESWPEGIAAARIPANNNTRAMEAFIGPAISATTTAQPGSPAERDIYIIPVAATGTNWATFAEGDVAIFFDSTWTAFAAFEGLRKTVLDEGADGENWQFLAGAWAPEAGGSTGVASVVAGTGIDVDATDPANPVVDLDAATIASLALADSATQPGDLATVATSGAYADLAGAPSLGTAAAENVGYFATAAQGTLADSSVQPADSVTTLNMATDRLLGRSTAGTGAVEEITLGTNLTLTAGVLDAAGGGGGGQDDGIEGCRLR